MRVVQASILGSILVNLLPILGTALLASSVVDQEPLYNTNEAQLLANLLFVSVFVFLIPVSETRVCCRVYADQSRLPLTTRSTNGRAHMLSS